MNIVDKKLKTIWINRKAELSNAWKGGCWRWIKRKTLERDNYTCKVCGLREPEIMEVDHIKPKSLYPELKCDINNLITLCPNCHARKSIKEQKDRIQWNKGLKATTKQMKNKNIEGLKLGQGWNKGIKVRMNTGRTHFKKKTKPLTQ